MTYRVVRITTNDFGPFNQTGPTQIDESVFWTGDSIEELSRAFPPSKVFGADRLGHTEIEDGLIRFDYRFEQEVDGEWVQIDDPRVRLNSALTEIEKAQDAENRRLYPGDFITEDGSCDHCGSYHDPGCCNASFYSAREEEEDFDFDDGVVFDQSRRKFVYRDSP